MAPWVSRGWRDVVGEHEIMHSTDDDQPSSSVQCDQHSVITTTSPSTRAFIF